MTNLVHELERLIEERYANTITFSDLVRELSKLGISRFNYDNFTNEFSFYSSTAFVHRFQFQKLRRPDEGEEWKIGDGFSSSKIQNLRQRLKQGEIDNITYHQQVNACGLVSCQFLLDAKKLIYNGHNGEIHQENLNF